MASEAIAIIPLRWMQKAPRYLLLRQREQWVFPKAIRRADETHVQCAKRAMLEATQMNMLSFRWGHQDYYDPQEACHYHAAENPFGEVQLAQAEDDSGFLEFRWYKFREARQHLHLNAREALCWAHDRVMADPPETIHKHNVRTHVSLFCRRRKNRQPA